jgi:tRNA (guanine37-N1)-methyltransferase
VILDKHKHLRTVVNKLNVISNQLRVFDMELLAGEPDYLVEHHEQGCKFAFDFTKVYWNSRLHTEHSRLSAFFASRKSDGMLIDVFAGVGPFTVPAARSGTAVFANDLNPESVHWLDINVKSNRVRSLPACLTGVLMLA